MKKYLLLGIACLLVGFAQGQEEENTVELGFNSLYFIQQLAKLGQSTPILVETYGFSLKRIKGKNAFRMGLGFDYKDIARDEGSLIWHLGTRMGYEGRRALHERVTIFMGVEGVFKFDKTIAELQSFDPFGPTTFTVKVKDKTVGGNLFLGVDFKLNDRLSLTTESGFTYTQLIRINEGGNVNQPNSILNKVGFYFPTSIFLAIKFNRNKNE